MRILAIESTCDETAAAVLEDGVVVRSNVVSSQVDLHQVYRGVVPEIASRAHIEQILPVVKQTLEQAGIALADVDAIAVAQRPGLIGSLLIGVTAAKTLAWAAGKPLVGVDHVQAHLYSVMLGSGLLVGWGKCLVFLSQAPSPKPQARFSRHRPCRQWRAHGALSHPRLARYHARRRDDRRCRRRGV
ncbi:MAG: hypothetical protein QM754_19500 [Tepidisphaeraceae bacterium]